MARKLIEQNRRKTICDLALKLLASAPEGIPYSALRQQISARHPEYPINTIHGSIYYLATQHAAQVYKPARGIYRSTKFRDPGEQPDTKPVDLEVIRREEEFYEPFAAWLVEELDECTKAIPLGGNRFHDRWGTPDVIGVLEPGRGDIIKLPIEIVSAELKIDRRGLITAFGQACAYKVFSHKSYLVVPRDSPQDDLDRLDVPCRTIGIGLIWFDANDPKSPKFEIRVRAAVHAPDMFYVNKYVRLIEDRLFP